jgi:hypothetical protein
MGQLAIDRYSDLQIAIIEERMRCRPHKLTCYLGEEEHLRQTIYDDAKALELLGTTHAEIVRALDDIMSGQRSNVTMRTLERPLECPFEIGTIFLHSNQEFTVRVGTESITFPGILMHMIAAHQFFGGRHSTHRLDPQSAVKLLRAESATPPQSEETPA